MKEGQVNSKNFRANTNAFCREDVCERKTFFLCAYTCVFFVSTVVCPSTSDLVRTLRKYQISPADFGNYRSSPNFRAGGICRAGKAIVNTERTLRA